MPVHPDRPVHHPTDPRDVEHLLQEAGWVRTLAARLAHDHAAAEDAAQATLTLALERNPAPAKSLRPWLARVLGRLTRRERRGSARRALREAQAVRDRERERDTSAPSSDTQLARLEEQERLARAVRALDDPYRSVILAHFYEGLDAAHIAARNGTSPATVRSQLARGLAQLRERLTREHRGDRARTLSLFVLAAGRDHAATPPLLELLAMQTTTKLAIGATFIVVTALATGTWVRWSSTPLQPERGGTAPLHASTEDAAELLSDAGIHSHLASAERAAASALDDKPPTSGPTHAAPSAAPRTIVRARAVGDRDTALVNATLASVHGNGRPRRGASSAPSGPEGNVRLALADEHLSLHRSTVFPMVFAVRAPGHATRFVVSTPALHAETDLGPVALPPGGGVRGRVIDVAGRPIEGTQILGGNGTLPGELAEIEQLERAIRGPDLDVPRPFTTSDADGAFLLEGLEVGPARLWVHAPRYLWHSACVVEVASGAVHDIGDLVLEPVPPARAIAGSVVLPDGAPAADMQVAFGDSLGSYEARTPTDVDGHFLIVPEQVGVQPRGLVTLVAVDPARRYGPSAETVVAIGATDVRLELRQLRTLEVTVTNAAGELLEDAFVGPLLARELPGRDSGHRLPAGEDWTKTDAKGRAALCVPDAEFVVGVGAPGYRMHHSERFAPGRAPSTLVVALELEPMLRGVVVQAGEPVAGARLTIGAHHEGFVPLESGFPLRMFITDRDVTESDSNGRFTIPVEDAHIGVSVLARSAEHATGEVVVTLTPGRDVEGIVIELTAGGAVEGTLLPPPGVDPRTLVVAASRGDGFPVWTRPDAEGRYRLERLTPGPWRVEGRDREPTRDVLGAANRPDEKDFRWNVDVREGATARCDVDMREQGAVALHGHFLIDGAPASGWRVALELREPAQSRAEPPAATLDDTGRFVLTAPAGRYDVRLTGALGEHAAQTDVTALRELDLRGPRLDWESTLTTGALRGSVAPGTARLRLVRGHFRDGEREVTEFVPGANGAYDVRVPAGKSSLQHESEGRYGFGWHTLETVEPR
jgi:RNA polymerase sigma factor (sigma-70 family)